MGKLLDASKEFKRRGDEFIKNSLKESFHKIIDSKGLMVRYLDSLGCPASYIAFDEFPVQKPLESAAIPQYIALGKTVLPVSKNQSYASVSAPFLLPMGQSNAFFFEANSEVSKDVTNLFQVIMLRLALSLPLELCKFHMVDCNFGRSFSNFNCLKYPQLQKELYGPDKVGRLLGELDLILKDFYESEVCLYSSLSEYNKASPGKERPYNFVFIDDFPKSCSYQQLQNMINNGNAAKAGVYIFINFSAKDELPRDFDLEYFHHNCAHISINANGETSIGELDIFKDAKHANISDLVIPKEYNHITKLLEPVVEDVEEVVEKGSGFVKDFHKLPDDLLWAGNSAKEVAIPVGVDEEQNVVSLRFTQQNAQNTAVLIGASGIGKSKFLHSVILNSALHYSPDELELYLIDYSGVEFPIYRDLPHVKILSSGSEREFALSVLEGITAEGKRRELLCSTYQASSISELRETKKDLIFPRLLVIIDEFQKLFERRDEICKEAGRVITTIIKEYRKYGINLLLATQSISDISSEFFPVKLVGNRIVYQCTSRDSELIGYQGAVPSLENGEFIYNDRMGDKSHNTKSTCYWIEKETINTVLHSMGRLVETKGYEQKDRVIFNNRELPDFNPPACTPAKSPGAVSLYLGRAFSVQKDDVKVTISRETGDNVLIVGGDKAASQQIALYATFSAMSPYESDAVEFYILNFMRKGNPLNEVVDLWAEYGYKIKYASKQDDVLIALKEVKEEIDRRKALDEEFSDIYISIFALEFAQVFMPKEGVRKIEAVELLTYILKNGPLLGVYTILQVDSLSNMGTLSDALSSFNHRVALQMDTRSSRSVIDCEYADSLYNFKNKYTKHRAYYYNKRNNLLTKFNAYKPVNFDPEDYELSESDI